MDVNALYYCISKALEDKDVQLIEIYGIEHIFTLKPEKIAYITQQQGAVWITKTAKTLLDGTSTFTQLLINPDQIVYIQIFKQGGS